VKRRNLAGDQEGLADACSGCRLSSVSLNLALSWVSAGFFTQISTLADVQENVMEYLHVLSRPKVIDQDHDVVWTEAYIDSTVSPQGPGGEAEVYPHLTVRGHGAIL
jgi:hypothetical protein